MKNIIVNWVKEDEELLEPYEWDDFDDLKIIFKPKVYLVSQTTLHDFIYGCLILKQKQYYNTTFIVGDSFYSVVVGIDQAGKLVHRSLMTLKDRKLVNELLKKQEVTYFDYQLYDEGMIKEYGLTRLERIKKQSVSEMIDKLYVEDYQKFLNICKQLEINNNKYHHLKEKLETGYSFIHELLYNQLVKNNF